MGLIKLSLYLLHHHEKPRRHGLKDYNTRGTVASKQKSRLQSHPLCLIICPSCEHCLLCISGISDVNSALAVAGILNTVVYELAGNGTFWSPLSACIYSMPIMYNVETTLSHCIQLRTLLSPSSILKSLVFPKLNLANLPICLQICKSWESMTKRGMTTMF